MEYLKIIKRVSQTLNGKDINKDAVYLYLTFRLYQNNAYDLLFKNKPIK
jgi:hypothetical protein